MINNGALLVGQVIHDSFEIQFVICVSYLMLLLKVKSDSRKLLFSQLLLSFISGVSHKDHQRCLSIHHRQKVSSKRRSSLFSHVSVIHWVLLGLDLNRKESAQSWSKKVEDTRMEKNLKLNSQANGVHLSQGSVNDAKKSITRFQRTQL